jgi:hypothetical protein
MQGSFLGPPSFNFINLYDQILTNLFLSVSETFTMWPKEGMTLMLMLLNERTCTHLQKWCSGMTSDQFNSIIINIKIKYIGGFEF